MHFLNEKHRVVLVRRHKQVVVSQAHQAVELRVALSWIGVFLPQESTLGVFQACVVERRQDVAYTETLRDSLGLPILLLVERDVVVFADVLQGLKEIFPQKLFPLLLLSDDGAAKVEIVFLV